MLIVFIVIIPIIVIIVPFMMFMTLVFFIMLAMMLIMMVTIRAIMFTPAFAMITNPVIKWIIVHRPWFYAYLYQYTIPAIPVVTLVIVTHLPHMPAGSLCYFKVSIRPRACFFPLFSFLPLWLHYNLNPLCVQY